MKVEKNMEYAKEEKLKFTARQLHIVQAWAKYPTIAEASQHLNISEHTFQTHLRRMRKKINVVRTFDVYEYMKKHQIL